MATISRANLYHVPGKAWREWNAQARGVFNLVYSTMRANQSLFIHPRAVPHSKEQWHTAAWNAAWCAARAVMGDTMIGDTILEGVPQSDGVLRQADAVVAGVIAGDAFNPQIAGGAKIG